MATIKVNEEGLASGTRGRDTLLGDSRENILYGDGGDDLIRGGGATDFLAGGTGNDRLFGDAGNDILMGGKGRDTMTGGAGKDFFVFEDKLTGVNVDTITDFSVKDDSFYLSKSIFKMSKSLYAKNGVLKAGAFYEGVEAHDADDRILYNPETGALSYDADGNGAKAAQQFAFVKPGLKLTARDFVVLDL